jgi:hypothetical protein
MAQPLSVAILVWAAVSLLHAASGWTVRPLDFYLVNGEGAVKYLPGTVPGGFAVFDYNGDGRLDLFFPNGGELPSGRKTTPTHHNKLLRNAGGLRFEDVTNRAGLAGSVYSFGAAVGDYNGDRRDDLLVTSLDRITLYRNNGDGTFSDVTAESGLNNQGKWSVAAAWLDIENDGDADLFVVNYVEWSAVKDRECLVNGKPDYCHPRFYEPVPNTLFRNNGNGTFTDISSNSDIGSKRGKGMSAAVADFNADGLPDIYISNDRVFAFLFLNRGGGRFEEAAFDWGVAVPESGNPVSGMGADAQDVDNDGRPDLLLTALRDETFPLFHNSGSSFEEVTERTRVGVLSRRMSGWGVALADLDNDGWKDIAAACSDALSPTGGRGDAAKEMPSWFRRAQDGKFVPGAGWETMPRSMYRGFVAADIDNDGCLDVVTTALNDTARVLRNPCESGRNWVKVAAKTLGTRVRAGKQWRHVSTAVGYASAYAGPLHFGIGTETEVVVEAVYPDGRRRTVRTPANRMVKLDP